MASEYSFDDLELDDYDYSAWFKELDNVPPTLPLEVDEEEVKKGTGSKIVTPNKLLTRLPILLAQTKAKNNS